MTTWNYPILFAHRGGGTLAPENTIAGMKMAARYSYSAVEFDVKLSADGIAMLMHDDTLDRTTNGTGTFATRTAKELETLDAGAWKSADFVGEKIPRFSAVMQYLHTHGMNANIEIKPCPGREIETGRTVAMLAEEMTREHVLKPLITSFNETALRAARKAAPMLAFGLLVEKYLPGHDAILDDLKCVSLNCHHENVNAEMLQHLHERGQRVLVYTVNDAAHAAELFTLGVDGIFTDNLEVMARRFPNGLAAH